MDEDLFVAGVDAPKISTITLLGSFEFPFKGFGFQRFTDELLSNLHFVYAYLYDILIASKHEKQHLKIVFECLRKYGDVVNPSKCEFGQDKVFFLGYIISSAGIAPSMEKVAVV